jgi:hypothetical protein
MAGRGAIPVELSPDYIEAIRHAYVETDQPVRELCPELGISVGKLDRLIKKHGWPMRTQRPPRELPPPLRLREESRRLAMAFPARGAACNDAPQTRGPGSPEDTGVPGQQRTTKTCCAAPGTHEPDPAARLEALVVQEIAVEEAVRANLGHGPRERAEAERAARTLAILAQTLQNLARLRAGAAPPPDHGLPHDHDDDDDMPADLDEFRRELARRINAFVDSRTGGGNAGGDPDAASVAQVR